MTIKPTVPAIDAGARALFDTSREELRGLSSIATGQAAKIVLTAALPHLLPGLYVSHEQFREGTDSTIWAVNPDAPHLPTPMLMRTQANAALFDAVAALLPMEV